jgi:hypothetical protein
MGRIVVIKRLAEVVCGKLNGRSGDEGDAEIGRRRLEEGETFCGRLEEGETFGGSAKARARSAKKTSVGSSGRRKSIIVDFRRWIRGIESRELISLRGRSSIAVLVRRDRVGS